MRSPYIVCAHIAGLALLFAVSSRCSATVILTSCSANRVVVAADSLKLEVATAISPGTVCKIQQGANDCFAIDGAPSYSANDHSGWKYHYDLVPMAEEACRQSGTIGQRAERFGKAAFPAIRTALPIIRSQPHISALVGRPFVLYVAFFGGNPLTLASVEFVEDGSGTIPPPKTTVCAANLTTSSDIGEYGYYLTANKYGREHPELNSLDTRASR